MSEKVSTPARPVCRDDSEGAGEREGRRRAYGIINFFGHRPLRTVLQLPESEALVEIIFEACTRARAVGTRVVGVAAAKHWAATRRSQNFLRSEWSLYSLYTSGSGLPFFWGEGTLVVQRLECSSCEWFAFDRNKRLCRDSARRFGWLIFRSFFIGRNFLFRFRSRLLRRGGREFCQFHHPLRQGVGEYGALTEPFEGGGVDGGEGGFEGGELVAVATVERGHLLIRRDLECHPFVVGNEVGHKG